MRIDIACFSDQGQALGERLRQKLRDSGDNAVLARCGRDLPVGKWAAESFRRADALVFIGAAGIAVRAIAAEIVSKTSDPAVVVIDDLGKYAISLLSGHIGGANVLAKRIAALTGATPVVTTATDGNHVFAVDVWATEQGMIIANPERIKNVSGKLLSGREIGVFSLFPVAGRFPDGLVARNEEYDIAIDWRVPGDTEALHLVPRVAVLGVGCRKNTGEGDIEDAFRIFCAETGISPHSIATVCSIDLKKDEPGLKAFCERHGFGLETFDAATLVQAKGEFTASAFVASVTGVDNVCERSAVAGSGGALVAAKTAINGVTFAVAVREYVVDFSDYGDQA